MEVCYAYSGIGRVIMEMTASDWAAWFGAIGTMLATGVAVWLYWKSEKDAQKDKAARRTVLMAALDDRVRTAAWGAMARISYGASVLVDETTRDNFGSWRGRLDWMHVPGADRLFELQSELIASGHADDAALARFIETVRAYETVLNECIALGSSHDDHDRIEVPIGQFQETADLLRQRAADALGAVSSGRK